jgi:hypothetical protein
MEPKNFVTTLRNIPDSLVALLNRAIPEQFWVQLSEIMNRNLSKKSSNYTKPIKATTAVEMRRFYGTSKISTNASQQLL